MRKRGFTMPELLVVLVVIGMLAAILMPAVRGAIRTANNAAVTSEINAISQALERFKIENNCYPPSRILISETGLYKGADPVLTDRTLSFMRRIFPRLPLSTTTTTGQYDWNGNGTIETQPYEISGDECLVFFLGHGRKFDDKWAVDGFSRNPRNPLEGENRTAPDFEFSPGRLVDLDNDGFPEYLDPLKLKPYAYFTSYGSNYDPDDVNYKESSDDETVPAINGAFFLQTVDSSPAPNPYTYEAPLAVKADGSYDVTSKRSRLWMKAGSYQVISAGYDGLYGVGGEYSEKNNIHLPEYSKAVASVTTQPEAACNRIRERDNLTNFTSGTLD